jgi:hypothetical protein
MLGEPYRNSATGIAPAPVGELQGRIGRLRTQLGTAEEELAQAENDLACATPAQEAEAKQEYQRALQAVQPLRAALDAVLGRAGGHGDRQAPDDELVFLPSDLVEPEDTEMVLLTLRLDERTTALPVYSSIAELVACCGAEQPWVCVPVGRLTELAQCVGASQVLWDPDALGRRYW